MVQAADPCRYVKQESPLSTACYSSRKGLLLFILVGLTGALSARIHQEGAIRTRTGDISLFLVPEAVHHAQYTGTE